MKAPVNLSRSNPLTTLKHLPGIGQRAQVHYKFEVLDKGIIVKSLPLKRNLILNVGLDLINVDSWPACISNISVGSGTTPTKRDSGATTFVRVGTTVTANNAFFDPTDDDAGGRLLKFDSGEEMTVVSYVSATVVTVNVSGTLAASQGTLWYVNETMNQTEVMRFSGKYLPSSGCISTFSIDTWTHKLTFTSPAVGAPFTAREIGWSNDGSLGTPLFGRDLIAGGGVGLSSGQQIRVTLFLTVQYSPSSAVSYADVGNNGFNTAGQGTFEDIGDQIGVIDSSNGNAGASCFDPRIASGDFYTCFALRTDALTLGGMSNTPPSGHVNGVTMTKLSYGSGNYYVDKTAGFSLPNNTFTGFSMSVTNSGIVPRAARAYTYKFTTPQTTDGLHNLFFTMRFSWGRILVN